MNNEVPVFSPINVDTDTREVFDEGEFSEILAFLAQELLEKKPDDPLQYMIDSILTFPFAGGGGQNLPPIRSPNLCKRCAKSKKTTNFSHYAPTDVRPCCIYELRNNFSSSSSDFMSTLANFFSSGDSVMIIVGNDLEGPFRKSFIRSSFSTLNDSPSCDCTGSGKSRLRRWLTFPGRYVHRRRVLLINSSNVGGLVEFLGSVDSNVATSRERHLLSRMSAQTGSTSASPLVIKKPLAWTQSQVTITQPQRPKELLGSAEPTLTLIEGIEPPHSIIHALMSRNFFKAERFATCKNCGASVEATIHKTIVFTRPGVFFKFPLAAPIYTIVRRSQLSQSEEAAALSAQNALLSSSFTNIICEKPEGSGGASSIASVGMPAKSPPVSPTTSPRDSVIKGTEGSSNGGTNKQRKRRPFFANEGSSSQQDSSQQNAKQLPLRVFKEEKEVLATAVKLIYRELCHFYEHMQYSNQGDDASRTISFSLDVSPTFSKLNFSRSRVEVSLAAHMIDRCLIPTFDMSEFPNLLVCIVLQPRSDVYISRYLNRVVTDLKKAVLPSRIVIGNLLCIVSASQQCASPYTPPATASDLLQLYLDAFIGQLGQGVGGVSPRSFGPTPISSTTSQVVPPFVMTTSGTSEASAATAAFSQQQQQTLMTLDIQNLVIENFQLKSTRPQNANKAVLVSHSLLDARGADIAPELLQFLVRGTTVQGYLKSMLHLPSPSTLQLGLGGEIGRNSAQPGGGGGGLLSSQSQVMFFSPTVEAPSVAGTEVFPSPTATSVPRPPQQQQLLDHPVLLLTDITDVGRGGFEGHGTSTAPRMQAFSSVLHCFLAKLANDGISVIIIVEKNHVFARTSFADPDTQAETTSTNGSFYGSCLGTDSTDMPLSNNVLWTLQFSAKKAIKNAMMLTENVPICAHDRGINNDLLLLVHADASCSVISINEVPHGASVLIQRSTEDEVAPCRGSARKSGLSQSNSFLMVRTDSATATAMSTQQVTPVDGALHQAASAPTLRRLSQVSNNSRITADIPVLAGSSDDISGEEDSPQIMDCNISFISIVDSARLRCDEPFAVTISPAYIAACNQDSDLIIAIPNPFANRNHNVGRPADWLPFATPIGAEEESSAFPEEADVTTEKFFQADGNVTCIVICNDVLVAGLENGVLQSFSLAAGTELGTMEHHEGTINVLRNMTKPPQITASSPNSTNISASFSLTVSGAGSGYSSRPSVPTSGSNYFIAGSEDSTITVWSSSDNQLVRTLRHHETGVVDICGAHVFQNRIIVSCDRSGLLTVVMLNPDDMREPWQIVWMSNFTALRHLSLGTTASWLVCSRHQQVPLAMPIAQWALFGNGQFHRKPISVVHITASERYLLTGGEDGVIFVWRLNAKMKFVLCFRQHASNSTITSISTNSDESRVASADNKKFIYIWSIAAHYTEAPKMLDRGGGGFVKYVSLDYLVVQTRKGVKLMDPELKVVTSSNNTLADGAVDVYVASEQEYEECFANILSKPAAAVPSPTQQPQDKVVHRRVGPASSDSSVSGADDETYSACSPVPGSNPLSEKGSPTFPHPPPLIDFPQIVVGNGHSGPSQTLVDVAMATSVNPPGGDDATRLAASFTKRCFIAVSRSSTEKFTISIYSGESLAKSEPCLELSRGDVEDEFGDEEEVLHTDTVKTFVFLQKKPPRTSPSSSSSSSLAIPNLHLAASAGDDLIVILWNWRKQQPLCSLQHTQFVNAISFLAPTMDSHSTYPEADMAYLRKKHPSFVEQDLLVARLVTCQDADSNSGTTIRVFAISENPRSFQKRFLSQRCGQPITTVTFDYKMLQTTEVSTSKSPNTESMPRCIAVRNTDGLVLTGHDNSNEVVFWKWLPERPALTSSSVHLALNTSGQDVSTPRLSPGTVTPPAGFLHEEEDDSDDDSDREKEVERTTMCLRPLRRLVSRV